MNAITEEQIADLVDSFYAKVRGDAMLGPIFDGAIGDHWAEHLATMRRFWSSILLASRAYKGNPMMAHLALPRLTSEHFERWLELWRETAPHVCGEQNGAAVIDKAERIGERLLHTISLYGASQVA